jgi:hypothetical protein
MSRRNPQVEHLEYINGLLRKQIESMRQEPADIPFAPCGHGCVIAQCRGMAPNSNCSCDERKLRRAVMWWRRRAEFLQITIRDLISAPSPSLLETPPEDEHT